MFSSLREDVRAVLQRDPAARTRLEVLLCYPGLHAVWGHRVAHALWGSGLRLLARWLSHVTRALTGIEIHPGAVLGPRLFIDHGAGVVIGETAVVGADVTLYHGVTLGGTSLARGKRHPTLEDGVVVGAGAKILGDIVVGAGSRVGANAVVVRPVPPDSVVVGVPGEVVRRSASAHPAPGADLEHGELPDVLGQALVSVMDRVDALEKRLEGRLAPEPHPHQPTAGAWKWEDFVI
ncbi:MAG TPA: serine O-acetyltransferase [Longimicrobiales bacterium]|nr:serine O-acetyltransferase [Longimicrobiales bacterium]